MLASHSVLSGKTTSVQCWVAVLPLICEEQLAADVRSSWQQTPPHQLPPSIARIAAFTAPRCLPDLTPSSCPRPAALRPPLQIIKFTGCYHGHADQFLVQAGSGVLTLGLSDSPGVPATTAAATLTAKYNDLESVKALFEANKVRAGCRLSGAAGWVESGLGGDAATGRHRGSCHMCHVRTPASAFSRTVHPRRTPTHPCFPSIPPLYQGEIAGLILEPVVGNSGFIPPTKEFLEGLREITAKVRCRVAQFCGDSQAWLLTIVAHKKCAVLVD